MFIICNAWQHMHKIELFFLHKRAIKQPIYGLLIFAYVVEGFLCGRQSVKRSTLFFTVTVAADNLLNSFVNRVKVTAEAA